MTFPLWRILPLDLHARFYWHSSNSWRWSFSVNRLRAIVKFDCFMNDRPICKSTDHLFIPILEVSAPLLRCVHCDVYAYHDTVKELAKNRRYRADVDVRTVAPVEVPYWRRLWEGVRRNLGFA